MKPRDNPNLSDEQRAIIKRMRNAKYISAADVKSQFLKVFVEKVGVDFLKERWPEGELDISHFGWSAMKRIANELDTEDDWVSVKRQALQIERPPKTIPPEMVVYDQKQLPKASPKRNLSPMELAKNKAVELTQDVIDEIWEGRDGLQLLRKLEVSSTVASMMYNDFMVQFESDPESDPEGEYKIESQGEISMKVAEVLERYAAEAKGKKPTKRRRVTRRGVSQKQIDNAKRTFRYKKIADEFKVSSIDPERIFGARAVLLFNVKYKKVTYLEAPPNSVLAIKGSSVIGFDKSTTMEKTVKDPKEQLDLATRTKAFKSLKAVKTKLKEGNGRSNPETIILAVY